MRACECSAVFYAACKDLEFSGELRNKPRQKAACTAAHWPAARKHWQCESRIHQQKKVTDRTSRQTQAASASAPLCTGADTCKTVSGARNRSGAKSHPARRRSDHAWTEVRAGKRKFANIDAVGGWRENTADSTPGRNAAIRSKHCGFMCQRDIRPRADAGASRNGTTQAVAATAGVRPVENAASNTASAWSDPKHTRKRSSRRRVSATELSRPGMYGYSNSRCSMWRHLCSLAA